MARTKPLREKTAAIVTISRAAKMSARGRRSVAAWLRIEANCLERIGQFYTPRYTGRYRYR